MYHGRVAKGGKILLDDPTAIAVGTEVIVRPLKSRAKGNGHRGSAARPIMKLAGKLKGLPRDASSKIDEVLYGRGKR
jgi:hypothetical protein